MYWLHQPLSGFVTGLLALAAAWYGGERFILRQVRLLSLAAQRLASGDLRSRTGLSRETGELGELARIFDSMAEVFEKRAKATGLNEKNLVHRSLQQTVVGALGQFALVSNDLDALLQQAVILATQTLELEYCYVLEMASDGGSATLRAGTGWPDGLIGASVADVADSGLVCFALNAGEPVVTENIATDLRFSPTPFLQDHGIVSGITVAISGRETTFGLLGVGTTRPRKFIEDEVHFLMSVAALIAMAIERHRAEAGMHKLAAFAQLNPNPAMELAADATITYFNDAALKLALSIGQENPRSLLPENIGEIINGCLETRESRLHLETCVEKRTLSWSFHPVSDTRIVHAYVEDITDRLNLEAQLRQSQKMESVGQLAAGIAHDFNNMLTIIQGHAGMLLTKPELASELVDSVQAVYFAAERAANLTRQLLMFSRKNVMLAKPLDLREVVSNMSKMLERLLGETIRLQLNAPAYIPLVQGDTGMIEQVLMNLAVNARDAMLKGGTLTISTSPVEVDEHYAATHPDARPGSFVCLRVTDTGTGMDAITLRRIFEPFFTTKDVGKGTGLGLATVYGIVKQHSGWIEVFSELGVGTTFNVFFPASAEMVGHTTAIIRRDSEVRGGKETILVVEDEPVLREMANLILSNCGYEILEASTGAEALRVWEREKGNIQLLLTDMVMPDGMSGMELAERLVSVRPELKVIFASGYSMDELDPNFLREGHAVFLQKPYTHVTLPKAVRDCLDYDDTLAVH